MVADLGNTRLKIARVASGLNLTDARAEPLSWPGWPAEFARLGGLAGDCCWDISSVNPSVEPWLGQLVSSSGPSHVRWYRSAADVPLAHGLQTPEATGADRALAVLGALARSRRAGDSPSGVVVGCGTALTVERIDERGVWTGGAIAPGLRLMSLALRSGTAQLPQIHPTTGLLDARSWGDDTHSAIEAGLFWSVIGTARELVARQRESLPVTSWVLWTGGDADWVSNSIQGQEARVAPHLVLEGLALMGASGDR
jgi:type III pantothenate kinase